MISVPVVSKVGKPLMPTTPSRAKRLIAKKMATPFFKLGKFCIRLNYDAEEKTQFVALGGDPGSKKEAYTVKSASHTYMNVHSDARTGVKEKMEERKSMRRGRRFRNTPYRQPRWSNRGASCRSDRLASSTKARADLRLSIIRKLAEIFPIQGIHMEEICAVAKKGAKKWNQSFSPLEVGKKYFHKALNKIAPTKITSGFRTSQLRAELSLPKDKNKMSGSFYAHNVDSWALANDIVGGHNQPDNISITYLVPFKHARRQLYYFQPNKKGKRPRFGGTRSLGYTRGSLVRYLGHSKTLRNKQVYIVGGYDEDRLTLCNLSDNERVSRAVKVEQVRFLSYNKFMIRHQ